MSSVENCTPVIWICPVYCCVTQNYFPLFARWNERVAEVFNIDKVDKVDLSRQFSHTTNTHPHNLKSHRIIFLYLSDRLKRLRTSFIISPRVLKFCMNPPTHILNKIGVRQNLCQKVKYFSILNFVWKMVKNGKFWPKKWNSSVSSSQMKIVTRFVSPLSSSIYSWGFPKKISGWLDKKWKKYAQNTTSPKIDLKVF